MIRLELSNDQAETLAAVLDSQLSDLRYEIANTDSLDFRETLKLKKAVLMHVVEQLRASRQTV